MALTVTHRVETWKLASEIRITNYVFTHWDLFSVTLSDGTHEGRGEASGVYYRSDAPAGMGAQLETLRPQLEAGLDRARLAKMLPPGGLRNALDCALWELEARRAGCSVHALAGPVLPKPLRTTFTLGAGEPAAMVAAARAYETPSALKLKLTGEPVDADRVRAVRAAFPDLWIGVDANQGFTRASFETLLPVLLDAGIALVEQPFPVGREADLEGFGSPIPVAADESVQSSDDLASLVGRFDVVNIKLDKSGGLTEALVMAQEARRLGFGLMVGNMMGTSLAMGPAFVVGQLCEVVDLDGPLAFATDRPQRVRYEAGHIWCGDEVWGA